MTKIILGICIIIALLIFNVLGTIWVVEIAYGIKKESCLKAIEHVEIIDISGYGNCYRLINYPLYTKMPMFIAFFVMISTIEFLIMMLFEMLFEMRRGY